MTEHDPAHDELVSAHLDGESTPEEAERIAQDPLLQARLETFTRVRDAVAAEVEPLDDADRDALLVRVTGAAMAPPNVVAISRWQRVQRQVLTVAAAIIAVAFLGGAIALLAGEGGGDDESGDRAAGSAEMAETTMAAEPDLGADDAAGDAPSTAYMDSLPPTIVLDGSFSDVDALLAQVRGEELAAHVATAAPTGSSSTAAADDGDASRSATGACTRPGTERVYAADLDGRPVLVFVEPTTITVLDAADCATVASAARG
jgi:hypothetical protein